MKQNNERPDYAALALAAGRRVVAMIARDALRDGYKVPIWENGRIVYGIPRADFADEADTRFEANPDRQNKDA